MRPANSSTSSSEAVPGGPPAVATRASLARTLAWTLVWLALLELGGQLIARVETIRTSRLGAPLATYFERGESTARRLRAARTSADPNARAMLEAGWIDPEDWRELPSARKGDQRHLVAFYGNSFTRQIATRLGELDGAVGVRMVFGPVAPASHAYASYLADRGGHEADVVVIGVVSEMLPGLVGMTRSTQSVVEPSPYTYPRYWLGREGELLSAVPALTRYEDFLRALDDAALWNAHLETLSKHDAFFSAALYRENALDELVLGRLLKSAWTIRRHRMVTAQVTRTFSDPKQSEALALVVDLLRRFALQASEDGRRPVVLWIDTPAASAVAGGYVRDRLAELGVTTIASAEACPPTHPDSYAADGHLSPECATRVTRRLRAFVDAR